MSSIVFFVGTSMVASPRRPGTHAARNVESTSSPGGSLTLSRAASVFSASRSMPATSIFFRLRCSSSPSAVKASRAPVLT